MDGKRYPKGKSAKDVPDFAVQTPVELLLVSHIRTQLAEWPSTPIDRTTMADVYLGSGEYAAITMLESLRAICEDHGWTHSTPDRPSVWRIARG